MLLKRTCGWECTAEAAVQWKAVPKTGVKSPHKRARPMGWVGDCNPAGRACRCFTGRWFPGCGHTLHTKGRRGESWTQHRRKTEQERDARLQTRVQ